MLAAAPTPSRRRIALAMSSAFFLSARPPQYYNSASELRRMSSCLNPAYETDTGHELFLPSQRRPVSGTS